MGNEPKTNGDQSEPLPGRDSRGRFVKGNPGSPGRPKGSHRQGFYEWAQYRAPEWWERLEKLGAEDPRPLMFLLDHYMGKAQQSLEVSSPEDDARVQAMLKLAEALKRPPAE